MAKLTGGEIIVDYLIKEGVTHLFGVPGHGNLGLMDALKHRQSKIKTILVRHEETAAFAADAFYRVSHCPSGTFTSCGAGSINILIGMAEAMANSIPMINITGNVSSDQFNNGALQETIFHQPADFPQVARNFAKRSFQSIGWIACQGCLPMHSRPCFPVAWALCISMSLMISFVRKPMWNCRSRKNGIVPFIRGCREISRRFKRLFRCSLLLRSRSYSAAAESFFLKRGTNFGN